MKIRIALLSAALGAAGLAQAASNDVVVVDQPYYRTNDVVVVDHPYYRAEPIIVYQTPGLVSGSPLHSGGASVDDALLADRVAASMAADRRIAEPGMTATVSALNGRVSISGSADNNEQAIRAEQAAVRAAGRANVTGMISSTGGA